MKSTIKLTWNELQALSFHLGAILAHSKELAKESLYTELQLEVLGELMLNKIHPKTYLNTGKQISIKLSRPQSLAFQLSILSGWGRFCPDMRVQSLVRGISYQLKAVPVYDKQQLLPPDAWGIDEEE
jgi:hypothetical protein